MSNQMIKPICLPVLPKDIFRILALRSIVEQPDLLEELSKKFNLIFGEPDKSRGLIPRTNRLDPKIFKRNPFDYQHNGRTIVKSQLDDFTERELCHSDKAFFGQEYEPIGKVIDYEIPLDEKRDSAFGKIDLISVKCKTLFLLEVKKFDSNEDPLRAMFEIFTFWKMLQDDDGTFNTFIDKYRDRTQSATPASNITNVIPGLLLYEKSGIFTSLEKSTKTPENRGTDDRLRCNCIKLYTMFLSRGLRIFTYGLKQQSDSLVVTEVTDNIKNALT